MSKITIIRGDDYSIPITMKTGGTAYDLTGCIICFTVKTKTGIKIENDDTYLIAKDITEHVDAGLGKSTLVLTHDETNISPGVYVYDFQIKTVGGEYHSTSRGEFEVKEDVTKRTI